MQRWEVEQPKKAGVEPKTDRVVPQSKLPDLVPFDLPVNRHADAITSLVRTHSVVIICGETGSGKSTQLPQFLHKNQLVPRILVTQPRRLAAVALATRVSAEMGVTLGEEVGYTVRFDKKVNAETTKIRFATEGMVLREILGDPLLNGYDGALIDEAHERTLNSDVILSLMREVLRKRPEFRLIISSATIDTTKFTTYFSESESPDLPNSITVAVYSVEGRTFPVEKFYLPHPVGTNYISTVVDTVAQIHQSTSIESGAILVFLPGQGEIEQARRCLEKERESWGLNEAEMRLVTVYANMSIDAQNSVFTPSHRGQRKVVLATNIAETSLTIPDVGYVVDTGLAKIRQYDSRTGMDTLALAHCSQASAEQRAGRAGRTAPGQCYRLYTKQEFSDSQIFAPQTKPEILRTDLGQVCLLLLSLGVKNVLKFPWIDRPPPSAVIFALKLLYTIGAVTSNAQLTSLGRVLSEFPTDPRWALALLSYTVDEAAAINEVAVAAGMVGELGQVYEHFGAQDAETAAVYAQFRDPRGDLHTLVRIYDQWRKSQYTRQWCRRHHLNWRALQRARSVVSQLQPLTKRMQALLLNTPCRLRTTGDLTEAVCRGYFMNTAVRSLDRQHYIQPPSPQPLFIHPSSVLKNDADLPEQVVYLELMLTTKEFMRGCMVVDKYAVPKHLTN